MYLCICKAVSDQQIRQAVAQGARTVGDVSARLGVGVECGKCLDSIREFLDECLAASPAAVAVAAPPPVVVDAAPPRAVVDAAPPRAAWFAIDL